ncbi:MAG: DUF4232 domain-containing protein [Catenulispora sp.]|nr:DUF4232 domain-containing protein [Catenulispora sp.]
MPTEFEDYFQRVRADLAAQPMVPAHELRHIGARRTRTRRAGGAVVVAAGVVALAIGVARFGGGASSAPLPPVGPTQNTYVQASTSSASTAATTPGTTVSGSPSTASVAGTAPTGTPATTGSSTDHPSTPSSTQATSSTPPNCQPAQISITLGGGGAAMGHEAQVLLFQNTGSTPCRLRGYPTVRVAYVSGKRTFTVDQTPRGFTGGLNQGDDTPPTVDLSPGQIASARIDFSGYVATTPAPCVTTSTVFLPGAANPIALPWELPGACSDGLQIHPFIPGTTGRQSG